MNLMSLNSFDSNLHITVELIDHIVCIIMSFAGLFYKVASTKM